MNGAEMTTKKKNEDIGATLIGVKKMMMIGMTRMMKMIMMMRMKTTMIRGRFANRHLGDSDEVGDL